MLPDYFRILEISEDASEMEIKNAYRKKAKEFHPSINKAADALDQFILINESYEILIHKNTHQIYLQDYKSHHDPLKYEVYYYWINVARTRAAKHATMSLEEFMHTEFFRNTHVTASGVLWVFLILGILMMAGPYIVMIFTGASAGTVIGIFIGLLAGTWCIVQASSGFSMMKKYIR